MAIQVFLVAVILLGMIMILLGINHFLQGSENDESRESTASLRRETEHDNSVISPHSVFRKFLVGHKHNTAN